MTSQPFSPDRIALLVDGDNVPAHHAPRIRGRAQQLGRLDVARVYANVPLAGDWATAAGYATYHAGAGKNAADVLLAIHAVDLAAVAGFTTFVLVTSDRDFAHVATYLRERGCHVLGLGEAKAPVAFREACSRFEILAPLAAQTSTPKPAPARRCTALDRQIHAMISQHGDKQRGLQIAQLGPRMHRAHKVQISTHPEKNWRGYFSSRPDLYDIDPRGPDARVRWRTGGLHGV